MPDQREWTWIKYTGARGKTTARACVSSQGKVYVSGLNGFDFMAAIWDGVELVMDSGEVFFPIG